MFTIINGGGIVQIFYCTNLKAAIPQCKNT